MIHARSKKEELEKATNEELIMLLIVMGTGYNTYAYELKQAKKIAAILNKRNVIENTDNFYETYTKWTGC